MLRMQSLRRLLRIQVTLTTCLRPSLADALRRSQQVIMLCVAEPPGTHRQAFRLTSLNSSHIPLPFSSDLIWGSCRGGGGGAHWTRQGPVILTSHAVWTRHEASIPPAISLMLGHNSGQILEPVYTVTIFMVEGEGEAKQMWGVPTQSLTQLIFPASNFLTPKSLQSAPPASLPNPPTLLSPCSMFKDDWWQLKSYLWHCSMDLCLFISKRAIPWLATRRKSAAFTAATGSPPADSWA